MGSESSEQVVAGRPSFSEQLERYGLWFAGTVLVLFVLEMTVITLALQRGVDVKPWIGWIHDTFGVDAGGVWDAAGPLAVAYAITRVLKPFQLALAAVLTPMVARLGRREPR